MKFGGSKEVPLVVNVKTYDGTEIGRSLKILESSGKIERWVMPTWCHMFNSTLIGSARVWFDKLPPESIDNYEMSKAFLGNYSQQKIKSKDPLEIHYIIQREERSMELFMERFKAEKNEESKQKLQRKGKLPTKKKPWQFSWAGQRITRQKTTQSFSADQEISFSTLGDKSGQETPILIKAEVEGHLIHRMYVDGGSASEVLYEHCFNKASSKNKKLNDLWDKTPPLFYLYKLWAHRIMTKISNRDTPFSLTYGTEAVIPVEIRMPSIRCVEVNHAENDEELLLNLDILEERREKAAVREARNKADMKKYYNTKVRSTSFRPGDFVYHSNEASHVKESGKMGPKWEGPYEVVEALGKGSKRRPVPTGEYILAPTAPKTANQLLLEGIGKRVKSIMLLEYLMESGLPHHEKICRIDEIDIDDLYNNLRVYEDELKRSLSSNSASQNLAFLSSENTGGTNEVSTASGDFGVSTAGGINQVSSTPCAHDVAYSFLAQPTTSPQLKNEDFQQMNGDDLEELDLRWQVAMLTVRVKKKGHFAREFRSGRNQGRRSYGDNGMINAPTTESSSQALVAQNGLGGYDWSNDFEVEPVNYALMAISSSSSSSSSDSGVQ
ncbi:hypothetical protein Tco_0775867 [Tanacetum coccineum]